MVTFTVALFIFSFLLGKIFALTLTRPLRKLARMQ